MSLQPGAPAEGPHVQGSSTSEAAERDAACWKGGAEGGREVGRGVEGKWGGALQCSGGLCHLQCSQPWRCLSRSAGLTFICLVPEAIRQFSWETAAKIYICPGVGAAAASGAESRRVELLRSARCSPAQYLKRQSM